MDNLTPPLLSALREVRWQIEAGRSTKEALREYLDTNRGCLPRRIRERMVFWEQGHPAPPETQFANPYQAAFWDLLQRGMVGHPIREALEGLEAEVARTADADVDRHVALLPFKALMPLLLFQFPAFTAVLILPLLRDLPQ